MARGKVGANSSDQKLILKMAANDESVKAIAALTGVNEKTVKSFIKAGKTNREIVREQDKQAKKSAEKKDSK